MSLNGLRFSLFILVTHGCVIATLTLFGPDGNEAIRGALAVVCLKYYM